MNFYKNPPKLFSKKLNFVLFTKILTYASFEAH
jgi:hypothetical protein